MSVIDVVSQSKDAIGVEDIRFHPRVLQELMVELEKWKHALEQVPPEKLMAVQSKVEILKWIIFRMPAEILKAEKLKAEAAEKAEQQKANA